MAARLINAEIRHIICIGLLAAGKPSVGGQVAAQLGWRLVEVDAEVEARTGSTVAELAYEGGEDAYRPVERQVVLDALDAAGRSVIAAPGAIALDPDARKAIGALDVAAVYLRADPEVLAAGIEQETLDERPLVSRLGALQGMIQDRDATYRALADVEVEVDGRSIEDIASAVIAALTNSAYSPP